MSPDELLGGRYRVIEVLGRGEMATTYLVEAVATGARRVLKRFSVREALGRGRTLGVASLTEPDALKMVELFEREGRILSELRHPAVPRFVEFVTVETPDDRELYLVQ